MAAVRLNPAVRLVLDREGQALAESGVPRRRDRLDQPAARDVDPGDAGVRDQVRERALLDHRLKCAVDVVRLVLAGGRDLDPRSGPGLADRLPGGVPAGEADRADGL